MSRSIIPVFIMLLAAHHSADARPIGNDTTTEPPVESWTGHYPKSSAFFVVVIFIFIFIVLGYFFFFLRGCIPLMTAAGPSTGARSRQGLDPAVIETFPVLKYSKVKDIKIGRGVIECAVCLTEFQDDDTLRLMSICAHVFHRDCIDTWLASHVTCPVCRLRLASRDSTDKDKNVNSSVTPQIQSNEVVINVNEDNIHSQQRARITRKNITRSHSTGHSLVVLVQPGDCTQRYTLRLPEEVRIVTAKLTRTTSFR